jgi:fatty acid desaturase
VQVAAQVGRVQGGNGQAGVRAEDRSQVGEVGLQERLGAGVVGAVVPDLQKKRELRGHLLAYLLFNGALVAIWALTGASFFWPVIPLLIWGIGLVFHAWDVYQRPFDEEQIKRELRRMR